MSELPTNIGFVGLGLMGFPMAKNLVQKMDSSTQFYIYDVIQENMKKFIKEDPGRVCACESSREVADKSDIILSMVPEGSHVRSVYLDPTAGILQANLGTKILIDCSTIDTTSSLAVRSTLESTHPQAHFYDAPVSGGVLGAEKGTLTFMLGCAKDDPYQPLLTTLLSLMGKNIFPCGGASLGLTAKLCNNYCSGLIAIAVSEAMNLGIKSGMDPRVLANVFHTSTAQSAICDDWCPVPGICPQAPASNGYEGGFRIELMRKDFGLAVQAAERVGARLELGGQGLGVYEGACQDEECKGKDSRVVYRYIEGEENWKANGNFEDVVSMSRDETRRLIALGKQVGEESQKD